MIVATRATERHRHERSTHRVDLFIDRVHAQKVLVLNIEIFRPDSEKASGD